MQRRGSIGWGQTQGLRRVLSGFVSGRSGGLLTPFFFFAVVFVFFAAAGAFIAFNSGAACGVSTAGTLATFGSNVPMTRGFTLRPEGLDTVPRSPVGTRAVGGDLMTG